MTAPKPDDVARLLEVASTAESEGVRAGALRRLEALRRDEHERRNAAVPHDVVAAARTGSATERPGATAAPALARLVASIAIFGTAARDARTPHDGATALARALSSASTDAFARIVAGLGRAQIAYLCRDLDAPSAARLARRLGDARAALPRYARLLPPKDEATLRAAGRRLAWCARDEAGDSLVETIGRALMSSILTGADASYEAAVRRRSRIDRDERDAFDGAWVEAGRAIAAHEAKTCHG